MTNLLSNLPVVSTNDTDEAQSVICRELNDVRFQKIRDRQRFHFQMNGVHLGRTMIGYNKFDTETVVDAGTVEDAVILVTSVGAPTITEVDGESVDCSEKGAVMSPARRVVHYRPTNGGVFVIRARIEAIESLFYEVMGRLPANPIRFDSYVDLTNGVGAQAHSLLNFLVDDFQRGGAVLKNPLLKASYDDLLLNTLLSLPNSHSNELMEGPKLSVAPRLVRRAEEFLAEHATQPITISDVAVYCECSRRALFNAFRNFRNYTPMQFLADSRLRSARKTLQSPSPADTVSSIAYVHGFSHLSRFSEMYRKRFGEKPSETLRKAQAN